MMLLTLKQLGPDDLNEVSIQNIKNKLDYY